MGWLARLFGQERPQRPPVRLPTASRAAGCEQARTPWTDAEERLVMLFAADVARFAAGHTTERFYGFGIDCDLEKGEILLCANTPEGLREQALENIRDSADGDLAEEIKELRWKPGYWIHYGLDPDDESEPLRYRSALPALPTPPSGADREAMLQCLCRALLRLQRDGHLDPLQRTLDFELVCHEFHEDPFDSEMRLLKLRGPQA
jgi:hypothetical protein